VHRVDRYARDVLARTITAGPLVRLACERHLREREEAEAGWVYVFNEDAADHVIAFYEDTLRLADTLDEHGEPIRFLLTPANAFIVGSVFGWKKRGTLLRRFREAYVEMGKGNGKTPVLAGAGLYGMTSDGERAAEIYSAATSEKQAKLTWLDASRMVQCCDLRDEVVESQNNLAHPSSMSFFRPVSNEKRSKSGPRPHMGLIDELHEHADPVVVNKIRAGAKSRRQPLFFEITNSGFDRTSICWQHHEHSRRVLEGTVVDDQWFAYVCALDEGDDPLADEACWPKANPNLGVVIQPEYLRRQVQNAKNIPGETNSVLQLNFCMWTQSKTRFFDMAKWYAVGGADVADDDLVGAIACGGLDMGQTDDFTALVGAWLLEDRRCVVRARFWLPQGAIEKYPNRPYTEWQRAGLVTVVDAPVLDGNDIEDEVAELAAEWGLRDIGYDKRFAQDLAGRLEGRGISMVDVPQGFGLNEGIKATQADVAAGRLVHGGHRVLAWMADNAVVRQGRQGEVRLDKEASRDKIDGVVALAMARMRLIAYAGEFGESLLDQRGGRLTTIGG
jgi:phage terminase large subunit-like protein